MNQIRKVATLVSICVLLAGPALAGEGPIPSGITNLDHVFVIMMENHAYGQIVGNPSSPFTNKYMTLANTSTNYFAIAHPSLTNYLEVVGGSNFGVLNDNSPDWHNAGCTTNLASGTASYDVSSSPPICPIRGSGTDTATPVFDTTNEVAPPSITSVTEGANVSGMTGHYLRSAPKRRAPAWPRRRSVDVRGSCLVVLSFASPRRPFGRLPSGSRIRAGRRPARPW